MYLQSSHARTQSQPLPSVKQKPAVTAVTPKRARAPSDPFLDTPALSYPITSTSSQSSGNTTALLSSLAADTADEPPSRVPSPTDGDEALVRVRGNYNSYETEEEYLRIWTSPDLSNPEFLTLLRVFPSFITRRAMPRFPVARRSGQHPDIEEADEEGGEGMRIRVGTGSMWIGSKERRDGWEGGWWARFTLWLRRTFC